MATYVYWIKKYHEKIMQACIYREKRIRENFWLEKNVHAEKNAHPPISNGPSLIACHFRLFSLSIFLSKLIITHYFCFHFYFTWESEFLVWTVLMFNTYSISCTMLLFISVSHIQLYGLGKHLHYRYWAATNSAKRTIRTVNLLNLIIILIPFLQNSNLL